MPILIKNESFNNIFLWKLCFIENNYFLCIVKLKKRRIMKYVIIGGVAGGATAAARLRRVDEMAEILLLEKGPYISYANCGLPYYIGGVIAEREKLLVQTPESFGKRFRIDVRVQNEVIAIHPKNKTVTIRNVEGKEYDESYDKLLLSPGANPVKPPWKALIRRHLHVAQCRRYRPYQGLYLGQAGETRRGGRCRFHRIGNGGEPASCRCSCVCSRNG